MDPNAALEAARAQASLIVARHDAGEEVETGHVEKLVESFQALDEWLSRGGFLPRNWSEPAQCTYCRSMLHRLDSVSHWEDEEGNPYCSSEGRRYHSAEPYEQGVPSCGLDDAHEPDLTHHPKS